MGKSRSQLECIYVSKKSSRVQFFKNFEFLNVNASIINIRGSLSFRCPRNSVLDMLSWKCLGDVQKPCRMRSGSSSNKIR